MAVSVTPFARSAPTGLLPSLAASAARTAISESDPAIARPIEAAGAEPGTNPLGAGLLDSVIPFNPDQRRRSPAGQSSWAGSVPDTISASIDAPRLVYNPRMAPSDAVPAMSKLEARIAFEPVFMHHYASTLYTLISRVPNTLGDRRQAFDLFA